MKCNHSIRNKSHRFVTFAISFIFMLIFAMDNSWASRDEGEENHEEDKYSSEEDERRKDEEDEEERHSEGEGDGDNGLALRPKNSFNIMMNYELGMHCTGFEFAYCCVLPPYNSISCPGCEDAAE
ncbi:MAG: hypothetical protein JAZ02_05270 [Candidatus Thiodiazotropha endolucinida]|nr:hypothetical protein [Candidatus Thiodiazotropha endolucinida]